MYVFIKLSVTLYIANRHLHTCCVLLEQDMCNMLPLPSTPRVRRCPSDVGKGIYQQPYTCIIYFLAVLPLPLCVHVGVAHLVILEYKNVSSTTAMLAMSEYVTKYGQ